jgi:hypothetical protein
MHIKEARFGFMLTSFHQRKKVTYVYALLKYSTNTNFLKVYMTSSSQEGQKVGPGMKGQRMHCVFHEFCGWIVSSLVRRHRVFGELP